MPAAERKLSPERRRRIVDAARFLILRQGLRATTMEAVAREAGVAKPTLYGYFPDRDAVFMTIVEDLVADIVAAVRAALDMGGDVVDRVGAALSAKYKIIARLLEGSPHADELYSEQDRLVAPRVKSMEQNVEAMIAESLATAGVARPRQLAKLLLAAAGGIARKASSPAEIGPAIRLLTERLLRPELDPLHGR